ASRASPRCSRAIRSRTGSRASYARRCIDTGSPTRRRVGAPARGGFASRSATTARRSSSWTGSSAPSRERSLLPARRAREIEAQVLGEVADEVDLDPAQRELPAARAASEAVEVAARDDRLERERIGRLEDEVARATRRAVRRRLDDRIR